MADANDGMAVLHPAPIDRKRTIIVTGLARSGTSMVAEMLDEAGLYLGTEVDPIVREDREIARLLGEDRLRTLVARRNRRYAVWGFKRPNLHVYGADIVRAFRNPRVILTSRDAVAIGRRDMLSEHRTHELAGTQIRAAAYEAFAMVEFATTLACPVLLLSYEKALQDPRGVACAILAFSGLEADADRVARTVHPNKPAYLENTERRYIGHIDDVLNNVVYGWAAEQGSPAPQTLEVRIDDQLFATVVACELRPDLLEQGIGVGKHGFRLPLPTLIRPEAKLTVGIADRTHTLVGSGRELRSWAKPS